jgi:hypothetical protein
MLETYLQFEFDNDKVVHSDADLNLEVTIDVKQGIFRDYLPRNGFNNTTHTQYTPSVNDAFYFLPGVLVPRVKLKDLYSKEKIKNVRDVTKATHVFCGAKTFDTITDTSWKYSIETDALREFIETAYEKNRIDSFYYNKVKDALEFYTLDKVLVKDFASIRMVTDDDLSFRINRQNATSSSQAFVYVKDDYVDLYKSIQGLDLYDDQALMPHINGPDSVTIDEAMFQTLDTMLSSSDRDNRVVAMEIMANCNYQESLMYLCILFHYHGHRISDIPSKNHVNFKSLVNYMGLSSRSLDITRDKCVDILIEKSKFDVPAAEYLLNKFADSIPSDSYSKYFKVKRVCLSPELDAMLNHELTLDIKEDYTPTINEIQPIDEPIHNFLNL